MVGRQESALEFPRGGNSGPQQPALELPPRGNSGLSGPGLDAPRSGWGRIVAVVALLLVPLVGAVGEVRLTAGVEAYGAVVRLDADDWRLASSGLGSVTLAGTGSRNVRGELALSLPLTTVALPQVDRAYLRFRLPWFRSTIGGAPLSWGEGILLNAADLPNPSYDPTADFTTGDYRSTSVWQLEVYLPIGALSFVELVALPELPDPAVALASLAGGPAPGLSSLPELDTTRLGGRIYLDADAVAVQGGYLYAKPYHRFFASLQGSLGADLYLSIAQAIDDESGTPGEDLLTSIELSGGGFYGFSLPADRSLSIRIEGLVVPNDLEEGIETGAAIGGLVDLVVSPTFALGLQSIVYPVDPSTLLASSASWNLDQGLTLTAAFRSHLGAAEAVFATDAPGGVSVTFGARYAY